MLLSIPSPTIAAFHVGPLVIRAYALCILAGIVVAIWLTGRRLEERGIPAEKAIDVAVWAVPLGILGGRIFHVITTPQPYFGPGGNPWKVFAIWQGGLGIWGAIILGGIGFYIGARRNHISFLALADSAVPGVAYAQAIGRLGNWFNNELYGRPTDQPWGLVIHEWNESTGRAVLDSAGKPIVLGTFQPVFLYEMIWLIALGTALLWLDHRYSFAPGQVSALYLAGYPLGRIVIEMQRSDFANTILGLRVNIWTSLIFFAAGVWWFRYAGRRPVPQSEKKPVTK